MANTFNHNDKVVITDGGSVGIGTTSPGARLEVKGNGTGKILIGDIGGYANYAGISLNGSTAAGYYNILSRASDGTLLLNRPFGDIAFWENNATLHMIIKGTSGNVGIGTSSPSQKLHVVGNQYITGNITVGESGADRNINFVRSDGSAVGGIGWNSNGFFYIGGHPDYGPYAGNHVRVYGFGDNLHFGNINAGDVATIDSAGTFTYGGSEIATRTWVSAQGYAVQQDIAEAVSNLVNSSPEALDTLGELANALGNDANFATTVTNSLAGKMPYYHGATSGDATNVINGVTRIYPTANDGPWGNGHFTVFTALQDNTNYGWQFASVGTEAYYRSKDTSYAAWQRIWSGADFSSTNVTNWNTAYGWGNHATANYWVTSNPDPQIVAAGSVTFQYDVEIQGQLLETSSIRVKENIVDLEPVGDKVSQLRPVRYNKIGTDVQEIGLIAEEVAELFPEVVHYNEDGEAESLNYTRLSVLLLQTVKELSDRIQKLENK